MRWQKDGSHPIPDWIVSWALRQVLNDLYKMLAWNSFPYNTVHKSQLIQWKVSYMRQWETPNKSPHEWDAHSSLSWLFIDPDMALPRDLRLLSHPACDFPFAPILSQRVEIDLNSAFQACGHIEAWFSWLPSILLHVESIDPTWNCYSSNTVWYCKVFLSLR